MLNATYKARPFVGGHVHQAFLSAPNNDRLHNPVSGIVVSEENMMGTYYSENYYEGFANIVDGEPRPDPNATNNSQPYIAELATSGIITIQTDDLETILMAAVFIGCEVLSCELFVKPGGRIKKDDCIWDFLLRRKCPSLGLPSRDEIETQ